MHCSLLALCLCLALLAESGGLFIPTKNAGLASPSSSSTRLQLKITPDGDTSPPNKRRSTISPEDLDSLFGGSGRDRTVKTPFYYEEEEEEEEIRRREKDVNSSFSQNGGATFNGARKDEEDDIDADEEEEAGGAKGQWQRRGEEELNRIRASQPTDREEDGGEEPEAAAEDDAFFLDLDRVLEGTRLRRTVRGSISMAETAQGQERLDRGVVDEVRNVQYDPKGDRGNPMKYGAYRRWKLAEEPEEKGAKGTARKGKSLGGGARKKAGVGKPSPPRPGKKDGKDKGNDFYNALKKLSSGPSSGGSMGTGVADPPPNKKPVVPKKAPSPSRKNKRKLITPGDIDSLFAKPSNEVGAQDEEEEDGDADEEEGEGEENTEDEFAAEDVGAEEGQDSPGYRPFGEIDTDVPEWLAKAEADRKEIMSKGVLRPKKTKKLTNDWRFWAAIVATAGFASAFWSVYQQTGGLGGGAGSGAELII